MTIKARSKAVAMPHPLLAKSAPPSMNASAKPVALDVYRRANPSQAEIRKMLSDVAEKEGIPPVILMGVAKTESNWTQFDQQGKPLRGCDKQDIGIMQINEVAHPKAFPRAKYDPRYNIEVGAIYLKELYHRYGNWPDAVAAYNMGSVKEDRKGHILNQSYIDSVRKNSLSFDPSAASLFAQG